MGSKRSLLSRCSPCLSSCLCVSRRDLGCARVTFIIGLARLVFNARAFLDPCTALNTRVSGSVGALRRSTPFLAVHLDICVPSPRHYLIEQRLVICCQTRASHSTTSIAARKPRGLVIRRRRFETTVNLLGNAVFPVLPAPVPARSAQGRSNLLYQRGRRIASLRLSFQLHRALAADTSDCVSFLMVSVGGSSRSCWPSQPDPANVHLSRRGRHQARRTRANTSRSSAGIHILLGASLARLEGAVALRKPLRAFPGPHRCGTSRYYGRYVSSGLRSAPS